MKELVLYIVKKLANKPDEIRATESEQDGVLRIRLDSADEDKGKIIGKQGKVIKAIRAVVSAAAAKAGKRVMVEVE